MIKKYFRLVNEAEDLKREEMFKAKKEWEELLVKVDKVLAE